MKNTVFCCPCCGAEMIKEEKKYSCEKGHSFDISGSGYVNLLLSNKSKIHGDDKYMVKCRKSFLERGYYTPLAESIAAAAVSLSKSGMNLLDAGCGEGWYTSEIADTFAENNKFVQIYGVDLSKDALNIAAKRAKGTSEGDKMLSGFAAASVYKLPVSDNCFDGIISVFSPFAKEEFKRALKKEGFLLRAFPLENHLFELKSAVYDIPYKNKPDTLELCGFELIDSKELKYEIDLDSKEAINELFGMTPYYYKTSANGKARIAALEKLTTRIEFCVAVYRSR